MSNDVLAGGIGNDTLDSGAGADTLAGGMGEDLYVVDSRDDRIIESGGAGTEVDTVLASVDWTLAGNLENLSLRGSAHEGRGNALDNRIDGNGGDNLLIGLGGRDTLSGGAGSDTYVVDSVDDLVVEDEAPLAATLRPGIALARGADVDTVKASVSWTLGEHLEDLVLTGSAAIDGRGNALDNVLTGNARANRLDGGLGADTLAGGLGNDVYVVDQAGDRVAERARGGIDTVRASLSWTLSAQVENLMLEGGAASSGIGNAGRNALTGNAAANLLKGQGGGDTLAGGAGDDSLLGGGGSDRLDGGEGRDVLTGGAGADQLWGGAGADLFRFGAWTDLGRGASADAIADFSAGEDRIDLSALDADAARAGRQALSFVTEGFGTAPGQVSWADGVVSINTDTDAAAEYQIRLTGTVPAALAAADFLL